MADHPQSRFSPCPLLVLAAALSAGILLGHYTLQSKSLLVLSLAGGAGVALWLIALWSKGCLRSASIFTVVAFFSTGMILSMIEYGPIGPNRISRLYDEGLFTYGQPVEITGVIQGQPEPAPDSLYLTIQVERISFKGNERKASGTVILLAHVHEQVRKEYGALDLRHGARVRVVTTPDPDDNF